MASLVPNFLLALVFIVVTVTIAVIGLTLFKRRVPSNLLEGNSSAISGTFGPISLLHAVIVGYVVAFGWNGFNQAQLSANQEALHLGDLLRSAQGFEQPAQREFQTILLGYANDVMNNEWPAMAKNEDVPISTPSYETIWTFFLNYQPKTDREQTFYGTALGQLNNLGENRRLRILTTRPQVHLPMWALFVGGGVIVIGYTYLFASRHNRFHMLKIALLAGFFGFVLYLVLSLQSPYAGDLGIKPEGFREIIATWQPRVNN